MHRRNGLRNIALLGAIVALVGAGSVLAAARPGVRFTSPMSAAKTGSKVTFTVKLSNFTLCAACVGKASKANTGHLHFAMDGGKLDYPKYSGANGKLAVQLGIAGKYSPAVLPQITYAHLPKGKHTLRVFVVNNDHSNTGVKASTTIWVK
ncbi:MAG: hypothetical protein QOE29_1308 [Gaiellaceae bacterium]|jgi:hypothetical protein|nr:hypothetical protein [Gaiellaceae bacterium]